MKAKFITILQMLVGLYLTYVAIIQIIDPRRWWIGLAEWCVFTIMSLIVLREQRGYVLDRTYYLAPYLIGLVLVGPYRFGSGMVGVLACITRKMWLWLFGCSLIISVIFQLAGRNHWTYAVIIWSLAGLLTPPYLYYELGKLEKSEYPDHRKIAAWQLMLFWLSGAVLGVFGLAFAPLFVDVVQQSAAKKLPAAA